MTTSNPFTQFFGADFMKNIEKTQAVPFDLKEVMEAQRKNMQAVSDAGQLAMASAQAIAQRQGEILSQLMEENTLIAKEMMAEGSPEQKLAKNAALFKKVYEKTVNNMQEISDMVNKSNTEATKILNKRVSASMSEVKSALEKGTTKKAA